MQNFGASPIISIDFNIVRTHKRMTCIEITHKPTARRGRRAVLKFYINQRPHRRDATCGHPYDVKIKLRFRRGRRPRRPVKLCVIFRRTPNGRPYDEKINCTTNYNLYNKRQKRRLLLSLFFKQAFL